MAGAKVACFEVDGFDFRLKPLPVLDSLDLLPVVFKAYPALAVAAQSKDNPARAFRALGEVYAHLRTLVSAFAEHCEVKHAPEALQFVPMARTFETLFAKQQHVLTLFAFNAIKEEYGDFLSKAFPKADAEGTASDSSSPQTPPAGAG